MPPMARTTRGALPSSNVDALDNLDLDDMFTAGGDALFEGLDLVDMGNIGELANQNIPAAAASPPAATTEPAISPPSSSPPNTRRKTKRKTTAPTFFDDLDNDDDDHDDAYAQPPKKKKRTSKGASAATTTSTKKTKAKKKSAAAAAGGGSTSTTTTAATSAASRKAKAAPKKGALGQAITASAAAAGKFGGRQSSSLAGATTGAAATKKSTTGGGGGTTKSKAAAKARSRPLPFTTTRPTTLLPQPTTSTSQDLFCGLGPSNTVFYPFLPGLPNEVALKNRKFYALLDRVHSSFLGQLTSHHTANNNSSSSSNNNNNNNNTSSTNAGTDASGAANPKDPIFQLTQEAYKEDKNATAPITNEEERSKVIGTAIGAVRKTLSLFDKPRLVQELLAVCALLRRQHDFVKQNNANMERWCRKHFNDDDFDAVYHEGKKKRKGSTATAANAGADAAPVLHTFQVPIIKVKIKCPGYKEPKTVLTAILPPDPKKVSIAKSGKKKADMNSAGLQASVSGSGPSTPAKPVDLGYTHYAPLQRRKVVGGLLARVAQSLESRRLAAVDKVRQASAVQDKRRKDVVEDSSAAAAIHTAGMWKYLQESGYFEESASDADLQDRLSWLRAIHVPPNHSLGSIIKEESTPSVSTSAGDASIASRLIGLLVEEGPSDGEDNGDDEDWSSVDDGDESSSFDEEDCLDLSALTHDERARVHLRLMGLDRMGGAYNHRVRPPDMENEVTIDAVTGIKDDTVETREGSQDDSGHPPVDASALHTAGVTVGPKADKEDTIDEVIGAMIRDLTEINGLLGARANFSQKLARSCLETPYVATRRKQREVSALTRGAALVKRNKEAKAKAGKSKSKQDDELQLPW